MELCARHYREQSQRFSSFRSPIMSVAGRNIPRRPGTLVEPLPMAGTTAFDGLCRTSVVTKTRVEATDFSRLRLIRPLDSAQEDESPRRLVPKSEGEGVVEVEFDFFG